MHWIDKVKFYAYTNFCKWWTVTLKISAYRDLPSDVEWSKIWFKYDTPGHQGSSCSHPTGKKTCLRKLKREENKLQLLTDCVGYIPPGLP